MARSSAMALRAVKRFLCSDTYLPTAFAMSARHDAFARIPAVSANSAINAVSSRSNSGRIVLARFADG